MAILTDRVAIVTGGGLGLGRAHSLELAAQGATVVIVDPSVTLDGKPATDTPAQQVVNEIEAAGGKAKWVNLSVTDFDGVEQLVKDVVDEFGSLDAVVNNAGITRDKMIVTMAEGDWDAVIAVHLKGTFNLIHHVGAHWRALSKAGTPTSGRIINTVSGTGLRGNVGQTNYGAAKAAIANVTIISGMELAAYGATVNAIAPVARTRMTDGGGNFARGEVAEGAFDAFAPGNSSPVVAYLASEKAGWINGQVIRVDGNKLRFYHRWRPSDQAYEPTEERILETSEIDLALKGLYGAFPFGQGDRRLLLDS
ncbi:MAG: putative short-chain type dehydrogenase/reductase [Microbacteriaceae bacterium]|jgi:NAD(P)-dependent dehydrogenase (short-subunit alcohol dehydrogenase family)|nr:putative short-chain type dehydrogenase/reductase [Microbacteriaceae bacterium]